MMKKVINIIMIMVAISINTMILNAQCTDHNHINSNANNNHQNHTMASDNSGIIKGGTHSFKVDGNCETCKNRIEKSALSIKGVKTTNWNVETHILTVDLKSDTNLEDVYQAVAKVGHDNEKYKTADKTYNALPMCCQYRK